MEICALLRYDIWAGKILREPLSGRRTERCVIGNPYRIFAGKARFTNILGTMIQSFYKIFVL